MSFSLSLKYDPPNEGVCLRILSGEEAILALLSADC